MSKQDETDSTPRIRRNGAPKAQRPGERSERGDADRSGERKWEDIDAELDEALEESFPASDPPSITRDARSFLRASPPRLGV